MQTEPYIPEPRPEYPPPPPPITDLERKFEGPLLSQAWKVLSSPGPLGFLGLPYLADPGLALQELVAPALHNFSLSSTKLQVGCLERPVLVTSLYLSGKWGETGHHPRQS